MNTVIELCHLNDLLVTPPRTSFPRKLVGVVLLALVLVAAGCGEVSGQVSGVAPSVTLTEEFRVIASPTLAREPTPRASPTRAVPTPSGADEPLTAENPSSPASADVPESTATERVVFTQVRSVAPP